MRLFAQRHPAARPLALLGALLTAVLLLAAAASSPLLPAQANGGPAAPADPDEPAPIQRVLVLDADVSVQDLAQNTYPALTCLARSGGVAALNTRSDLHRLGAPAQEPGTWTPAGIPAGAEVLHLAPPPVDPTLSIAPGTEGHAFDRAIREVLLPELPTADAASADCAQITDAMAAGPRTLILSVGTAGEDRLQTPGTGLQMLLDTGAPGTVLRSPSTRMDGLALLTDIAPTVIASHGGQPAAEAPGQVLQAQQADDPLRAALDIDEASTAFPYTQAAALILLAAPGAVALVLLLMDSFGQGWLRRWPVLGDAARGAVLLIPLVLGAGQWIGFVPWWRAPLPLLVLLPVLLAGALVLLAGALLVARIIRVEPEGPSEGVHGRRGFWQRASALAFGGGAALLLGAAAAGSPAHAGALLGPDLVAGGRFYGLSNHLFGLAAGMVFAALLAVLPLLASRGPRIAATLAGGLVVTAVSVAPSMGADFGSALAMIPALGVLVLLLWTSRLRPVHLLAVAGFGLLAVAAVIGVSVLDWLRPPGARTHLGTFIERVLSGQLGEVIAGKLLQNVQWTFSSPFMVAALLAAAALTVALIIPARLRWHRMAAWQERMPTVRPVLLAALVAGWIGYAVNDTGPLLVLPLLGMVLAGVGVLMPERTRTANGRAPAPRITGAPRRPVDRPR